MLVYCKGNVFDQPNYRDWRPMATDVCHVKEDIFIITLQYTWAGNTIIGDGSANVVYMDGGTVCAHSSDFLKVIGKENDWYWTRNQKIVHHIVNEVCNEAVKGSKGIAKYLPLLGPNDTL